MHLRIVQSGPGVSKVQAKAGIVPRSFTWRDASSNYRCVVVDIVVVVIVVGVVMWMYR